MPYQCAIKVNGRTLHFSLIREMYETEFNHIILLISFLLLFCPSGIIDYHAVCAGENCRNIRVSGLLDTGLNYVHCIIESNK